MKLISLNVEGSKHLDRTEMFIRAEKPDVVCLQECDIHTISYLQKLDYTTHFLPVVLRDYGTEILEEGIVLASRLPMSAQSYIYFEPSVELNVYRSGYARKTSKQGFILGTITLENDIYYIASNHFTWTPEGNIPNHAQVDDIETLLAITKAFPSHIMCGDFNIPRHHNYLYEKLIQQYIDNVPEEYKSSMDTTLHKNSNNPTKKVMFTDYMVDYVFSQPPYLVTDVRLQFAVSDHAAVVATITL